MGSSSASSRRQPVTPSAATALLTSSGIASSPARNSETTYPSQVQPKADTSTSQNMPGPSQTGLVSKSFVQAAVIVPCSGAGSKINLNVAPETRTDTANG